MKSIELIQRKAPEPIRRKRVAAYCRISIETERMSHSLSAQVSHYNKLIQNNPLWQFAGVYTDDGISGTSTNRPGLQALLDECDKGNIDIILTKSISRFARNTLDLLSVVRSLREKNIEVRFEKEKINSLTTDGELMLTLLASFAQEESRSISENVKWGTVKRFKQGIPNGRYRIYGYRWKSKTELEIDEAEARQIREIVSDYLSGISMTEIAKRLNERNIPSSYGKRWHDSTIRQMLNNTVYTGVLVMQKAYSPGVGLHSARNTGALPMYVIEKHHEPIIDRTTFERIRDMIRTRSELGFRVISNIRQYLTCFSGVIKCGCCGRTFVHTRKVSKATGKFKDDVWICSSKKHARSRDTPPCPSCRIPSYKLRGMAAEVLGLNELDDDLFTQIIERITVLRDRNLEFTFRDGRKETRHFELTGHRDCWTEEYRKEHGERLRQYHIRQREARKNAEQDS